MKILKLLLASLAVVSLFLLLLLIAACRSPSTALAIDLVNLRNLEVNNFQKEKAKAIRGFAPADNRA